MARDLAPRLASHRPRRRLKFEHMCDPFERWSSTEEFPTLRRVNRPVWVDTKAVFPDLGRPMTGVAMWVRSSAARVEPWMPGHQVAWLRRFRWGMVRPGRRGGCQRQQQIRAGDASLAHT